MKSQPAPAFWATHDERFHPEDQNEVRTMFKHDQDEIVYSPAFRRLSDKSQIVVKPEHREQFRSRLTHTLEVQQIAQSIAIGLELTVPLADAIALGHDIGHSPFGHAGEREFQRIAISELLTLCDPEKLAIGFASLYPAFGNAEQRFVELREKPETLAHWLFHHALNSRRIIQRKMEEVTKFTSDGVLTHSWSPWLAPEKVKFGIPVTYEAQAVAIADQLAGINHDTEDILSCPESEHDHNRMRERIPDYLSKNGYLPYVRAQELIDEWFLPNKERAFKENGWARKLRLQRVIKSTIDASTTRLFKLKALQRSEAQDTSTSLSIEPEVAKLLTGYERFVREELIQKVSWFNNRDAIAAAVVRTVYNFFKYYGGRHLVHIDQQEGGTKTIQEEALLREIAIANKAFIASTQESGYERDLHFKIIVDAALTGKNEEVTRVMRALDYVSSMTDTFIMEIHAITFRVFR